ncbi:MAG: hypothetical protein PHW63_05640 [Alphaproteobacteria bacterium]|nr:hypothetical protein [Alphaproteobacteria bacterium]
MPKRLLSVFALTALVLTGAGCFQPKTSQTSQTQGPQPEEDGPPMPFEEYTVKAQEGRAIALKNTDGTRLKIVFPQGALAKDSVLEVAERPFVQGALSSGFSLRQKGSEQSPELKTPALLVFNVAKDKGKNVSIVRYTREGFEVVPTRVAVKDGQTSLLAYVTHFSDYGTQEVDAGSVQTAKDKQKQESQNYNWVIYVKDTADVSMGAMKRKITLDFKAVNTSGDLAGEYKGYARAKTENDMEALGGKMDADFQITDDNVSFTVEPYVELADLVEREDGLANLEPEKLPDLMGQGTLHMKGSGVASGYIGAYGGSRGVDATPSSDAMTVAVTGPLVRLSVNITGVGMAYFDGYIRGEGR